MIQMQSMLAVADNSGARRCSASRSWAAPSAVTRASAMSSFAALRKQCPTATLRRAKSSRCVVVRVKKEVRRTDGSYIKFDQNACVLIDNNGAPRGTRIFGPVARELRDKKYMKIVSLAPETL